MLLFYLEDEHLPSQYGQSVEASIADVGFSIGLRRSRRQHWELRLPVLFTRVRRRMGARRGRRWQRLGGLGEFIGRPCGESEKYILYVSATCCFAFSLLHQLKLTSTLILQEKRMFKPSFSGATCKNNNKQTKVRSGEGCQRGLNKDMREKGVHG